MSKKTKVLSLRIIFVVLIAMVLFLSTLTFLNIKKLNRLENQINNLRDTNEVLLNSSVSEYVILNFVDINGSITPYFVNKNLKISIYDFLLTTKDFKDTDFESFDSKNYYFSALSSTEFVKTEVTELKDNSDYYTEDEWGKFLIVGLQAITLDRNYTVVRSLY